LVSEKDARERIEELRTENEKRKAYNRLREYRWRDLSIDQLAKFTALLDEVEKS
jgi:hypothetical protein